jgi:ABC-type transport system involved in multi-copper enzyme maturation permease subunit
VIGVGKTAGSGYDPASVYPSRDRKGAILARSQSMDAVATTVAKSFKPVRLLPYWAVFQMDLHQTCKSWVYRVWVLLSLLAAIGYLLYRFGAYREAGLVQPASDLMSDLLRWTVLGSVTLIIVLTAGSISAERGTMADSVLCRGISRHQYFLGKWHARLVAVLGTFFGLAVLVLCASYFLLPDEHLSLVGCLAALLTVAALLTMVITCGVTISAISNSTLLSVAILWLVLYGTGFMLSLLPAHIPSPDRALNNLPHILRGQYDWPTVGRLWWGASLTSLCVAAVGMFHFGRRDV